MNNTTRRMNKQWNVALRRPTGVLALTALATLACACGLTGCGGGGGSSSSTANTGLTSLVGSYQGVYSNNSGYDSPGTGTVSLTVTPSGTATGTTVNTANGQSASLSGTVNGDGTFQLTQAGNNSVGANSNGSVIKGTLSRNMGTGVISSAYASVNNGNTTQGILTAGPIPSSTPLAGSYVGTDSTSGGYQGNMSLTITPQGAVTGTVVLTGGGSGTVNFTGYVDSSGRIYLSYASGGTFATLLGLPSLSGTTFSGKLQEYDSDQGGQAGPTVTLSLTKQ